MMRGSIICNLKAISLLGSLILLNSRKEFCLYSLTDFPFAASALLGNEKSLELGDNAF
jgi:hypothetical protein